MKTAEEVYEITYNPTLNAIVMVWRGYATSKQFRAGSELMLEMLIRHQCSKVLGDTSEMAIIGQEDQHWLENNFIPRAVNAGFRAFAIITPKAYFNKVAVETVSYKVDQNQLRIAFFTNREEAEEFLLNNAHSLQ